MTRIALLLALLGPETATMQAAINKIKCEIDGGYAVGKLNKTCIFKDTKAKENADIPRRSKKSFKSWF